MTIEHAGDRGVSRGEADRGGLRRKERRGGQKWVREQKGRGKSERAVELWVKIHTTLISSSPEI